MSSKSRPVIYGSMIAGREDAKQAALRLLPFCYPIHEYGLGHGDIGRSTSDTKSEINQLDMNDSRDQAGTVVGDRRFLGSVRNARQFETLTDGVRGGSIRQMLPPGSCPFVGCGGHYFGRFMTSANAPRTLRSRALLAPRRRSDPVKRGYVRSCQFRSGNVCGEVSLPARCSHGIKICWRTA
jgi:hypothetical protein